MLNGKCDALISQFIWSISTLWWIGIAFHVLGIKEIMSKNKTIISHQIIALRYCVTINKWALTSTSFTGNTDNQPLVIIKTIKYDRNLFEPHHNTILLVCSIFPDGVHRVARTNTEWIVEVPLHTKVVKCQFM